jgi:threonine/homoserine/homoserine lactone efflux protein
MINLVGGRMLTSLFLKGSLIGFSIAMPVGPVGMLCIQHSLRRGMWAGLIAGAGAASADALFGGMAGFGVSLLSHVLIRYQIWFQIFGALFLWYLGIKIFKSKPLQVEAPEISFSCSRIYFSTFVLTLTNPLTLLCFAAIYASLGITPSDDEILPGMILTLGVLLGAATWWMFLTFSITMIGKRFQLCSSPLLNRISGGVLTGCGCLASFAALKQLIFFA